ncbi:uncharacterized protein LOC113506951 [Trichoplusia ni]|uniref:Sucrose-6-phosphate hydrolase n=1 Tax=Trichoplusia ni TaxID=7111 RepID=A0A7E5WYP0_TRINI|nr:uncharacterized protein LOC113506951 [Trichoplusia ni]
MLVIVTKFLLIALCFYRCSANNVSARYYPRYHLAPPYGWMNDPNGFCVFNNEFHLFYQFNPESSQDPGIAHWGHARSADLFHWEHLPIAMYPDRSFDKTGVFSGSALIENRTMYLFYTGNVNFPNQYPERVQRQALAFSKDGVHVEKYEGNPILKAENRQPHIRDPKVWKHGNTYYMVLGNSYNNHTVGRVLLYTSKDLVSWTEASILGESDGSMGYMWECPDFFELGGKFVLLFSPQGLEPRGDKYRNLYQTGYIVGNFDYESKLFTPLTEFMELDHGHDFYATQTTLDTRGNRVVVAWFDMWEQNYPDQQDGFNGQMTLPRYLYLTRDFRLLQKPVRQVSNIRGRKLYSGRAKPNNVIKLDDNSAEIRVVAARLKNFELLIESENNTVSISYDYRKGKVTLDRGGNDGVRRTNWRPSLKLYWQIFIDASSIEVFCGNGEVTFSSRFFPTGNVSIRVGDDSQADELTVFKLKRSVDVPDQ